MNDRELDAWLAEHLFGWHVEGNRRGNWQLVSPSGDVGVMYRRGEQPTYIGYQVKNLPLYSSTGAGVLLVLEAMRERGWNIELSWTHSDTSSEYEMARAEDGWMVRFHKGNQSFGALNFYPTAPLAVALAAKDALEATQEVK